ncbi:MAG: hypothetical protein U0325_35805 [Polyangiales bacterium]
MRAPSTASGEYPVSSAARRLKSCATPRPSTPTTSTCVELDHVAVAPLGLGELVREGLALAAQRGLACAR